MCRVTFRIKWRKSLKIVNFEKNQLILFLTSSDGSIEVFKTV